MISIKKISGKRILQTQLAQQILDFDKRNMRQILAQAGIPFPEEKRRKGFEQDTTFLIAMDRESILGYLQYCRNWDDREQIYISSLQIAPQHRGGFILLRLLNSVKSCLLKENFTGIVSAVQKNNSHAICLYRKLGFQFEDNPKNDKSYLVSLSKEIPCKQEVDLLLEKWNKRLS